MLVEFFCGWHAAQVPIARDLYALALTDGPSFAGLLARAVGTVGFVLLFGRRLLWRKNQAHSLIGAEVLA